MKLRCINGKINLRRNRNTISRGGIYSLANQQ